ncbi:MAG: PEP-CTERM sorting domain-containing protein [Planctomycetota bacterium]
MTLSPRTKTPLRRLLTAFVFVIPVLSLVSQAEAQNGFSTAISSNEAILEAPNDMMVQKIVSWDSPLMRVVARSRPFIEVKNTSANERLTTFSMTIGDTDFNFSDAFFGEFAVLGTTSSPGVGIESATVTDNGDVLNITFANGGLAPQELARFQFDIDPDPGIHGMFIHPDYRTVLFDLFDDDDSDNSVLTATYSAGPVVSSAFPDQPTPAGPIFVNGVLRPYSVEEPIDRFGQDPVEVIPEPSSVLLFLTALSGFAAAAMRRRLG